MSRRTITTEVTEEDKRIEGSLRPQTLDEYIGQERIKSTLKVFIHAAKSRGEALDHVLFYGPPGLGKTTLSGIIANEMGVNVRITSGPAIEKAGDLAALLTNLNENDILFVDEIHRLNRSVEEVLYPAMEDFAIDIIIGKGPSANSIRLDLPKFTLIGATTRAGQLSAPLRDRFGVTLRLELYTPEELALIVKRSAGILGVPIEDDGAMEIARRSRGFRRSAIVRNRHGGRRLILNTALHVNRFGSRLCSIRLTCVSLRLFRINRRHRHGLLFVILRLHGVLVVLFSHFRSLFVSRHFTNQQSCRSNCYL